MCPNHKNPPTKRQRLVEWIKTKTVYIRCLQETHLETRDINRLKVKGWKRYFMQMETKKAGVKILKSDEIDFDIKAMKRDKEGHYIMI